MSFPRYPKYKASGVQWLGEVPEHWEVCRARQLGRFTSSGIDKKLVDGEQRVQMFNYLDVYRSESKVLKQCEELMWTTAPAEKVRDHSVRVGDILLTPSSETNDDIGHAAFISECGESVVYSYHLIRFRTEAEALAPFITYCFNALPIRSYFESVCTGTTRMVLVREDFQNAPFALPPLPEQAAIASFLDRETGKIDALVAEQRRLMELLKEKRQAVISHAVTRGLPPEASAKEDAPLKDSGIDWLGPVPAHWEVLHLRRLTKPGTSITYGIVQAGPDIENGIPYIRTSDMSGDSLPETGYMRTTPEIDASYSRSKVQHNDLVVAIRASLGKGLLVPDFLEGANLTQGTAKVSPGEKLMPRFLLWAFNSAYCQTSIQVVAKGTTFLEITLDALRRIPLAVPPLFEQAAIVERLDQEIARFDTLISEAQRAIDLLQERRTALIAAAVTGQIDVRETVRGQF